MRATTGGFLGLLAAALGGGTPCAAQGSLEFAGFGGLYAPSPGLLSRLQRLERAPCRPEAGGGGLGPHSGLIKALRVANR